MNKLIKTENILSYLKQYCTNIPIDSYRDIECALGKELVINDEELRSDLKSDGTSYLCLEIDNSTSLRFKVAESFMYKTFPYDSVSVKCILDNYSVHAVPSQR